MSDTRPTGEPESTADETSLMAPRFWTARPLETAQASMDIFPLMSVAVVTTGTAPIFREISNAYPLAPPMWPDRRGTQ
jgi:hypothetical protein